MAPSIFLGNPQGSPPSPQVGAAVCSRFGPSARAAPRGVVAPGSPSGAFRPRGRSFGPGIPVAQLDRSRCMEKGLEKPGSRCLAGHSSANSASFFGARRGKKCVVFPEFQAANPILDKNYLFLDVRNCFVLFSARPNQTSASCGQL